MTPPVVLFERRPPLVHIRINRPEVRNAVDGATAAALAEAFHQFEQDDALSVAILSGSGGGACCGFVSVRVAETVR